MRKFFFLLIISFSALVATSSVSTKLDEVADLLENVVEEIDIDLSALSKVFEDDYAYLLKNTKRVNAKNNNNFDVNCVFVASNSIILTKETSASSLSPNGRVLPTLEEITFLHLFHLF